jgi:hypothetical protein
LEFVGNHLIASKMNTKGKDICSVFGSRIDLTKFKNFEYKKKEIVEKCAPLVITNTKCETINLFTIFNDTIVSE